MLCGPVGNLTEKVNGSLHVLQNNPLTPTRARYDRLGKHGGRSKSRSWCLLFRALHLTDLWGYMPNSSHLTLDSSSSRSHYNLSCHGYGRRGCLGSSRKAVREWIHGLNTERKSFLTQDRSPPAVHKALLAFKATWYQDTFSSNSLSAL